MFLKNKYEAWKEKDNKRGTMGKPNLRLGYHGERLILYAVVNGELLWDRRMSGSDMGFSGHCKSSIKNAFEKKSDSN